MTPEARAIRMPARTLPWGLAWLLPLALWFGASGCASYPARTEAAFHDFRRGQFAQALKEYSDPKTTGSPFLQWAEAGMVALAAGDWTAAVDCLGKAGKVVEETERKALISPESAGETLLTWTVNETYAEYEGEGYERILLHAALAVAYLGRGDLEGARVELRQTDALLRSEQQLYAKDYKAGGLGNFLSAVVYEIAGHPDEAYIDYKRMESAGVGAELFGPALARLAQKLDDESGLELWEKRYGVTPQSHEGQASIVVIAGVGLGPYKQENTLTIPTESGLLQWSVPSYQTRPQPLQNLVLEVDGAQGGGVATVVIEDVSRVARENLEDRLAWLAAKSTVRAFLKRELSRQLQKDNGIGGAILGALFTLATERADLRAWQTLPDSWQAARVFVAPGSHDLSVSSGGGRLALGRIELDAGETVFLFARTIDAQVHAYLVGGRPVQKGNP